MKKTIAIFGVAVLGLTLLSFKSAEKNLIDEKAVLYCNEPGQKTDLECQPLNDVVFIEEEDTVELGFDTADYLPFGFNAYEGLHFDLDDIEFIETEDEIDLGFDTAEYLPADFNAHETATLDLDKIDFIESEDEFDLGYDTSYYLPLGFNAYEGVELDINEIIFIELEDEIDPEKDVQDILLSISVL